MPFAQTVERMLVACEGELRSSPAPPRAARLHYEIGRLCESPLGETERALAGYLAAVEADPSHIPALRGARRLLVAAGSHARALELIALEVAVSDEPGARVRLLLAKARILAEELDRSEDALVACDEALGLDPGAVPVLTFKLSLQRAAGATASAGDTLEVLARAAPDPRLRAAYGAQRASAAEQASNLDVAARLYRRALEQDPKSATAVRALKQIEHSRGEWDGLATVLAHEAEHSDDGAARSLALYRLARLQQSRLGGRKDAIATLERARAFERLEPNVVELLARYYSEDGRWEAAAELLISLVGLRAEVGERLILLERIGAIYQEHLGDDVTAAHWYQRALDAEPGSAPALEALEGLYAASGRWDALVATYRAAAAAAEDGLRTASCRSAAADVLETRLDNLEEALAEHRLALAAAPGHMVSFRALERLYRRTARHRELVELYDAAVERAPTEALRLQYLRTMAAIYEELLGEPGLACDVYDRILELREHDAEAAVGLQRAAERAGRWDRVVLAIDRELERTEDGLRCAQLGTRAAELLDGHLNRTDDAVARLEAALAQAPGFRPALWELARIHRRDGRWEKLLRAYERECEALPEHARPMLYARMGRLSEEKLGSAAAAVAYYRAAVAANPAFRPALSALERLLRAEGDHAGLVEALSSRVEACRDDETRADAALRLAEVYEEILGDREQALHYYEQAVRSRPDLSPAAEGVARLNAALERWDGLAQALEREAAHARDPETRHEVWLRRAAVLRDRLGDPEGAAATLGKIMQQAPGHLPALLALEELYLRLDRGDALARVYEAQAEALDAPASEAAALRSLARLERKAGTPTRTTYERVARAAADDPDALEALEGVALASQDRELLRKVDVSLANVVGEPAQAVGAARARLGESLEMVGDVRALDAYRAALVRDPDHLGAVRGLTRVAEACEDWEALVEALGYEARLASQPHVAGQLLVRRARIRQDRLSDTNGAVTDLQMALERDPDGREATDMLAEILVARKEPGRLIHFLTRTAGATTSPARRIALWQRVAELYESSMDDAAGAIRALEKILEGSPDHPATRIRLGALLARGGRTDDALRALTDVAESGRTDEDKIQARLQLAQLCAERLGDADAAAAHLGAVLKLAPGNRDALTQLAELHLRGGQHDAAAETLRQLVGSASDPSERSQVLLRIGQLELKLGRLQAAQGPLAEAVALDGPVGPAADALLTALEHTGEWVVYEQALQRFLRTARESRQDHPRLYVDLSRMQARRLDAHERAALTLRNGLERHPDDIKLRGELAKRLRKAGRVDEAVVELYPLLVAAPANAQLWRDYALALGHLGQRDRARMALEVVDLLGEASGAEKAEISRRRVNPGYALEGSYGAAHLRALSGVSPGARAAEELLHVIAPMLGKVFPPSMERYGLTPRDRHSAKSEHPMRQLADPLADIFDLSEYDIYLHRAPRVGTTVELTDPPALIVPEIHAGLPDIDQVFILARMMSVLARRVHPVIAWSGRELEVTLAAATRLVIPDFGGNVSSAEYLDEVSRKLNRVLSRKDRKPLAAAAERYAKLPLPDLAVWQARLLADANRVALMLADQLAPCVDLLRRTDRDLRDLEGPDLVRASPLIRDLVLWWPSEPAMQARRRADQLRKR